MDSTVELARRFNPPRARNQYTAPKTVMARFLNYVCFDLTDHWFWYGATDQLGYGDFPALDECSAHRVAWRLFKGDIPNGLFVLHTCDIRNCVNPDHLFLGTQTDNMRDMTAKGRGRCGDVRGERNAMAKLTVDLVRQMKRVRAETGHSYKTIGAMFGVSTMTAFRAITGRAWDEAK